MKEILEGRLVMYQITKRNNRIEQSAEVFFRAYLDN